MAPPPCTNRLQHGIFAQGPPVRSPLWIHMLWAQNTRPDFGCKCYECRTCAPPTLGANGMSAKHAAPTLVTNAMGAKHMARTLGTHADTLGLDDVKAAVFFGTAFAQCFLPIKKIMFLFSEGGG